MTHSSHQLWTEDELDQALNDLLGTILPPDVGVLARSRERLVSAARRECVGVAPRSRRRLVRATLIAACLAVLALGVMGVVSTTTVGGHHTAASAQADTVLRRAVAALAGASGNLRIPAGQYLLTTTHEVAQVYATDRHGRNFAYLQEDTKRTWQPADPAATWLEVRTAGRVAQWQLGLPSVARAEGYGLPTAGTRRTAPCGDFDAVDDHTEPCRSRPGWQNPRLAWLASLPRNPDALYSLVEQDAPSSGPGGAEIFTYLVDALRSGLVPADLRASFYIVMTRLPGLVVTENAATLDGHHGTALGIDDGTSVHDIVIDPDTGQFIGERETLSREADGMPAGTLLESTSVGTRIVASLGATG